MVGRALALGLNENGQTHEVFAVPCGERFEKLDTLSVGAYLDFNLGKVRTDAIGEVRHEALYGQFGTGRSLEFDRRTLGGRVGTLHGIER